MKKHSYCLGEKIVLTGPGGHPLSRVPNQVRFTGIDIRSRARMDCPDIRPANTSGMSVLTEPSRMQSICLEFYPKFFFFWGGALSKGGMKAIKKGAKREATAGKVFGAQVYLPRLRHSLGAVMQKAKLSSVS